MTTTEPALFIGSSGWWLLPHGLDSDRAEVAAFQPGTGRSFQATGELARYLAGGEPARGVETLRRLSPLLDEVVTSLERHGRPTPLDRSILLRGDGYDRLFVELTARCNEQCVHCYADSSPLRSETLSKAQLRDVISDGAQLGFPSLQLTGGDPLIHPDVVWAVHQGRDAGYRQVEVYTNGLALTQRMYDALRPAAPDFAFSFYSHDETTHDRITRVPGSWHRTLDAMDRAQAGGSTIRVGIVVTALNPKDAEPTKDFLQSRGVARGQISVDVSREVGRGAAELGLATEGGGSHGSRQQFYGRAAVSYDGNVYPCIFSRSCVLGTIHQRRLRDILTDPRALAPTRRGVHARSRRWARSLSCWQCQLRAEMLLRPSQGPRTEVSS